MTIRRFLHGAAILLAVSFALPSAVAGEDADNDGTDPTRPIRKAWTGFETMDLAAGDTSNTLFVSLDQPLGDGAPVLRLKVPVASVDTAGNDDFGIGDVSMRLTKVVTRNKQGGWVVFGEMIFDTADRPELGTGKHVAKASVIYAKFLSGGRLFAPAVLHSVSVAGDESRADINTTTLDFYFVPRFKNPKLYMTVDPFATFNWEGSRQFAGLAVTGGYKLGPMLGGRGQIYLKPTAFVGDDRAADWAMEVGFQLIAW